MEYSRGSFYEENSTATVTENITVTAPNTMDYDQQVKILIYVSAPTIFIVGLMGNILTLIVMMFGPSFQKLNTSVHFTALAVVDTVCLCVQRLARDWLEMVFGVMLDVISVAGCKTLMFTHYFSSCCGSWLIVTVTLERLFVVCFPLKAKVVCTRRSAIFAVIAVVLLAMLASVYTLFLFDIDYEPSDGYLYCSLGTEAYRKPTVIVDFVLYSFLPSIVLWIANVSLIVKLYAGDVFRQSLTYSGSSTSPRQQSSSTPRTSLMLLTVSFTFLLLTTPISLFFIIQNFVDIPQTPAVYLVREVLSVLSCMNPAVNFLLYCFSGPRFRRDLVMVFTQCNCMYQKKPVQINGNDKTTQSFRRDLAMLCRKCRCVCSKKASESNGENDSSMRSCSGLSYRSGYTQQIYRLDSLGCMNSLPPPGNTYQQESFSMVTICNI